MEVAKEIHIITLKIWVPVYLVTPAVTVVTASPSCYCRKHSFSCYFVRNTSDKQLVYLFTVQPNKYICF